MASRHRKRVLSSGYKKRQRDKRRGRMLMMIILAFCFMTWLKVSESDIACRINGWRVKYFSEIHSLEEAAEAVGRAFSNKADGESAIVVFGKMILGLDESDEESPDWKSADKSKTTYNAMAGNYSGLALNIAESGMPSMTQEDILNTIIEEEIVDTTPDKAFEIPSPDIVDDEKYNAPFTFALPLSGYRVTSQFGYRIHPISGNTTFHYGMDMAAAAGTKVCSAADGVVSETGYGSINGNYVKIKHVDGFVTHYTHLKTIDIARNQNVTLGQKIGTVGSTGYSTGPHLHFEIRKDGKVLDPNDYLAF